MKKLAACLLVGVGLAFSACGEDREGDPILLSVSADADGMGDGVASTTFRTITRALVEARNIRFGTDGRRPSRRPIIITVSPGTYRVSRDAAALDADATLERGPILLNVDRLTLRGALRLQQDAAGLPTDVAVAGTETLITWRDGEWNGRRRGLDSLLLLSPTVAVATGTAMVGSDVTVEGFILAEHETGFTFFGPQLIWIDRVQGFRVRGNLLDGRFGAFGNIGTSRSSGSIEDNFITRANAGGVIAWGGEAASPATIDVRGNRITGNGFYALVPVGQDAHFEPPILGAQDRFTLPLPSHPASDSQSITLTATGNEFSDHEVAGIRACIVSRSVHPRVTTGHIAMDLQKNRFLRNGTAVLVDAVWPTRRGLRHLGFFVVEHHWTGMVDLRFVDNAMVDNEIPAIFEFTREAVPPGDSDWEPLESSIYRIDDPRGELSGYAHVHPARDPIDGRELHNRLEYNGAMVPASSLRER
jgi:hypothetical protein